MEQAREMIEEFIRRYGALVLAVAVGVLLALLMLRALRALRVLAGPALIGALLVVGWLLR